MSAWTLDPVQVAPFVLYVAAYAQRAHTMADLQQLQEKSPKAQRILNEDLFAYTTKITDWSKAHC